MKKLLLVTLFGCLGSVIYGMEKESVCSELPLELKQYIASLLLEKELGYNYKLFKNIDVGDRVISVAFSPDGKTILTGSYDATARLWDVETGELLKVFKGHTRGVTSVVFSPDGKTILTGSYDNTARLWDAETGEQLKQLKGHESSVNSVAISPDGKTILTGSGDTAARLWDRASGEQLKEFKGHIFNVYSVAFSPDGKTIITGSVDKTVRLWDVESGEQLKVFTGHTNWILSVAFSPDGKTILTGANDKEARLWDVKTGKQLKVFKGHTSSVLSVAFSPDGKTILTGGGNPIPSSVKSKEDRALLWDVESGNQLKKFKDHNASVNTVAFSKDGEMIATGSSDKSVILYRRSEESPEETKERFKKRKEAIEKGYQEKVKFLLKNH